MFITNNNSPCHDLSAIGMIKPATEESMKQKDVVDEYWR